MAAAQSVSVLPSFFLFFFFLKQAKGCDQYSGRRLLMLCQNLFSWASCFSVPLSEVEFMAGCLLSVTSGTV